MAKLLLQRGARVHEQDKCACLVKLPLHKVFHRWCRDGWMPIHYVAEENHLLMATLLLSHHASVKEKEK